VASSEIISQLSTPFLWSNSFRICCQKQNYIQAIIILFMHIYKLFTNQHALPPHKPLHWWVELHITLILNTCQMHYCWLQWVSNTNNKSKQWPITRTLLCKTSIVRKNTLRTFTSHFTLRTLVLITPLHHYTIMHEIILKRSTYYL